MGDRDMKFKLLGALGVAAVGVLGLGLTNTGAWFTDQEVAEVTASSGSVDIAINGQNPSSETYTVTNLMPGVESGPYYLEINNFSPNAVKYRVTSAFDTGSQYLFDGMQVRVEHGNCVGGTVANAYDIEPLKLLSNLNFNSSESITNDVLPQGNSHCFNFFFRLPPSADNTYVGLTTTFDIVVDATQPENPGFNE
jgi:predicted ribosomally synthesized peptide with SipW-like signal peptide